MSDTSDVVERAVAELIDLHREDRITLDGSVLDLVRLVEPDFQADGDDEWRVM
jgi:hypothetical protein